MNEFENTDKDNAFNQLIKDLQPITRKSQRKDFGSGGTHGTNQFKKEEKDLSEHTIRFDYKGFEVVIELK